MSAAASSWCITSAAATLTLAIACSNLSMAASIFCDNPRASASKRSKLICWKSTFCCNVSYCNSRAATRSAKASKFARRSLVTVDCASTFCMRTAKSSKLARRSLVTVDCASTKASKFARRSLVAVDCASLFCTRTRISSSRSSTAPPQASQEPYRDQ